jgi:hypothetical protein
MNQKCESGDILYSVKAGVIFGGSETWSRTLDSVTFPEPVRVANGYLGVTVCEPESATPIQAVNADASAALPVALDCNPGQENNVTRLPRTSAALTHSEDALQSRFGERYISDFLLARQRLP